MRSLPAICDPLLLASFAFGASWLHGQAAVSNAAHPHGALQGAARATRPGPPAAGSALSILVYDPGTFHGYAQAGAMALAPGGTTVAGKAEFNALLTGAAWDAVAVDARNLAPDGGWTHLMAFVDAGGAAIVAYSDWNASGPLGDPFLAPTFDVLVQSSLGMTGKTLFDAKTTPLFLGVDMPHDGWLAILSDDGDTFTPASGAQALAHVGDPSQPVMVRGNGGRTIAALELDAAGGAWDVDGDGARLWENMLRMVTGAGPRILVYDHDAILQRAQRAAFELSPGNAERATKDTFADRLADGPWDAVLVDCPNTLPASGWGPLIDHVALGGRVAMSYWDWDGSQHPAAELTAAFDVDVVQTLSWQGETLFASGVTGVFDGVTVPVSDWVQFWNDDGDTFTPQASAVGLAHVGDPAAPVIVWGNAGRTIAASVLDEPGTTWDADGSGVRLWENMAGLLLGPAASSTPKPGVLGLNPLDYTITSEPVVGGTWISQVDTTPVTGGTTLSTLVSIGLGGAIEGVPAFGYELLILPPVFETVALGTHVVPMSPDPLLVGLTLPSQAARVEVDGTGLVHIVLTNGQDLHFGL